MLTKVPVRRSKVAPPSCLSCSPARGWGHGIVYIIIIIASVASTIFVRIALGTLLERFGPVNVQCGLMFLEHYLLVVIWGGLMEAVQQVLRILLGLGQAVACNLAFRFLWTCVIKVFRKEQLFDSLNCGTLIPSIKQRRMHSTRAYLHDAFCTRASVNPDSCCYVLAALQIRKSRYAQSCGAIPRDPGPGVLVVIRKCSCKATHAHM